MKNIVIAGGGIGGLALAVALRRRGLPATVLERATAPDDRGSGLVLAPNGMKAVDALGKAVGADVRAAGVLPGPEHRSPFVTARGRVLSTASFATTEQVWGAPVVSLRRRRLHDVLLGHAVRAGAELRTGVPVTGYDERRDGITAAGVEADVLVGADGLRSAVRMTLLADGEPRYRGYTAVRGIGPAVAAMPHGFIGYGRGLILFAAPVDGGRLYWVASITAPPAEWPAKGTGQAYRDLLALLRTWHPDLTAVVAGSDPDGLVLTDIFDRDPVPAFHRGRVVLLGDAARPMTYTMGQGANTALEDAVTLAHHLATAPTTDSALARYTTDRADRTAKIVRMSRAMGTIGQVRHPGAVWARDRMMALMGRLADPEKQNAAVFGWRPPGPTVPGTPPPGPA